MDELLLFFHEILSDIVFILAVSKENIYQAAEPKAEVFIEATMRNLLIPIVVVRFERYSINDNS